MTDDDLLREIEAHAARAGLAPATVTSRAAGNSRLYENLKGGKSCTLRVATRIRKYIRENSPSADSAPSAEAS